MADPQEEQEFDPEKDEKKPYGSRKAGRIMKKEKDDGVHRSQERIDYFPDDTALRAHGFVIAHRPKDKEAIWIRNNIPYSHSEAMQLLRDLEAAEQIPLE